MKVLNITPVLDPVTGGGTAERTVQMSCFLTKAGVKCGIVTMDIGITPALLQKLVGVEVTTIPCLSKRFYVPRPFIKGLRGLIASADIIHLMNHWTFINGIAYLLIRSLRKPYVVCPAGALPIYGRSKIIKNVYNEIIGKRIIRNANGHIAITPEEISQFQAYGVADNHVSVIPNGIDAADFQGADAEGFRRKFGLGSAPFIMFMGRLNSIKGPDLLLRAFFEARGSLPPVHLIFVGPDGGMRSELEGMVRFGGIEDRVHFLGYLGGEDKCNAYHAAELLVIPSRQEAMSIVVLEAGIAGTPVLLTDRCGFDDVSRIGGGKVVPASIDGLKCGLVEMLAPATSLRVMGVNLQNHVREHFGWDHIINEYLQLYRQILGVSENGA